MYKYVVFAFILNAFGQKDLKKIDYYTHIKPIFEANCVVCHQKGGEGPFELDTYESIAKRSRFISEVIAIKYMPPFPADKNFQRYKNERGLTKRDQILIDEWIKNGLKKGKTTKTQPENKTKIGDWTMFAMNNPYEISNQNIEDYRYFHISTNNNKERYIKGIKFEAGNKKLDHHARIMIDTSGKMQGINGISELDEKLKRFQQTPLKDEFLFGWVPGNSSIQFPEGFGRTLDKDANIILNMHYAPSPIYAKDLSSIGFELTEKKPDRAVKTLIFRENDVVNQPFVIPANTIHKFYISKKIENDVSLISVMPHMHLLGKNIRCFFVHPDGEVTNIVKIDQWDFNWQMTYQFKKLLKIPAGSICIIEAEYDNTKENKLNPNSPPKDVTYSWGTKDEMLNVVFYYADYKDGDEEIDN